MSLMICITEWRRRWLAGDRVPVEEFLSRASRLGSPRRDLFELIVAEIELRQSQGEQPDRAEYVGRFPAYASRLETLFKPRTTLASAAGSSTHDETQQGNGRRRWPSNRWHRRAMRAPPASV